MPLIDRWSGGEPRCACIGGKMELRECRNTSCFHDARGHRAMVSQTGEIRERFKRETVADWTELISLFGGGATMLLFMAKMCALKNLQNMTLNIKEHPPWPK